MGPSESRSGYPPKPIPWRSVVDAEVVVAELIILPHIEAKIKEKPNHQLTAVEVREAVIYAQGSTARWVEDEEHGRRLVVRGRTYRGRPVIAYMDPQNPNDPDEGTFVLRTALTVESPGAGRAERRQA